MEVAFLMLMLALFYLGVCVLMYIGEEVYVWQLKRRYRKRAVARWKELPPIAGKENGGD